MAAPLSYRLFGSTARIPLVLLHAYPLDGGMWGDVITHLHAEARHIPVVTVDAPGFGDSPVGPEVARVLGRSEEPSLETYVEALDQTIAALNIDKIVLAGLSLGGYAALAYAEHYGDKIVGLALLDTQAEADEEEARQARLETARNVIANGTEVIAGSINTVLGPTSFEQRPEVVDDLRRKIAQAPPEGVAWIQRAMAARQGRAHVLAQRGRPSAPWGRRLLELRWGS